MNYVTTAIDMVIRLYMFVLLGRMILSLVPAVVQGWEPRGAVLVVAEVIFSLSDPPLRLLRRVFPPVRIGTVAFDTAFIVLFVLLNILSWLNRAMLDPFLSGI